MVEPQLGKQKPIKGAMTSLVVELGKEVLHVREVHGQTTNLDGYLGMLGNAQEVPVVGRELHLAARSQIRLLLHSDLEVKVKVRKICAIAAEEVKGVVISKIDYRLPIAGGDHVVQVLLNSREDPYVI
jgi:hypothetical protein